MCLWQISKGKLSTDFFFEGFEERHDDDDEDEGKCGENSAALKTFESSGLEENCGGEGLDDAPHKFDVVWRIEAGNRHEICC